MTDPVSHRPEIDDPTGQERLTRNVLLSWLSQLVYVVFGFIMPRLIDNSLGQMSLGTWDFGWTVVSYLNLVNFGVGANSARFIASYRAAGDVENLSRIVSCAHFVQLVLAAGVVLVVVAFSQLLPSLLGDQIGGATLEAQQVVLLLGLSIGAQMSFDMYRGVMTGCHRWDTHNLVNAIQYVVSAFAMIWVLSIGEGLAALALVYFLTTVATEVLRLVMAHRVCPEIHVAWKLVSRGDIRRISVFGLKNVATQMGPLIVHQTVHVLIAARLGPAMLAVFARPVALLRHVETFIMKFAFVLMPTVSSLQGLGKQEELREFAIDMTKAGWALGIPPAIFLVVYGPGLVHLWMGPDYVATSLIVLLAVTRGLTSATGPSYRILFGLNKHGLSSIASVAVFSMVLLIGVPAMLYGNVTLMMAAWIFSAGDLIMGLVVIPQQLAAVLGLSTWRFLFLSSCRPLLVGLVSLTVLLPVSQFSTGSLLQDLAIGVVVHGGVVAILYWFYVLPTSLKSRITSYLPVALT